MPAWYFFFPSAASRSNNYWFVTSEVLQQFQSWRYRASWLVDAWAITYEPVGWRFTIPYEQIVSYEYKEEVAHGLGLLPGFSSSANMGMFSQLSLSATS